MTKLRVREKKNEICVSNSILEKLKKQELVHFYDQLQNFSLSRKQTTKKKKLEVRKL